MANVMLTLLHDLGVEDLDRFGNSTGTMELNAAAPAAEKG
jgi:hypothetical protein